MQILKVIGLLMEYPDELLWECKEDALALIRRDAPMLTDFTHNLLNAPLLDKQAEWCEVFDRGRTTSLLLFEHVHAESRDRGQAMVDLLAEYEKVGLQLDCRELPDYLPLYLERRCWINRPNGAKCLTAGAPRRCCCSNMFMPSPAIAARQWWTCWRSMKRSACSWIVGNCPIIYRCIWSI